MQLNSSGLWRILNAGSESGGGGGDGDGGGGVHLKTC